MNSLAEHLKNEKILSAHRKRNLLSLCRKAFNTLSKLKLTTLQIEVSASFKPEECTFSITVFKLPNADNRTFSFYDFYTEKEAGKLYKLVLESIKKDDFAEIKAIKER